MGLKEAINGYNVFYGGRVPSDRIGSVRSD
jgi:hypothetical protein